LEFLKGAIDRGVKLATARQVWQMIQGFAGYSFSKAHAAAFAVIVYWSAWLRVHFPVEYFCGLLRNAPLGTYPANVLESEARRNGIKFLPFDINRSHAKPTVDAERNAIRHGLGYVKGIGDERAEAIVQVRGNRSFRSLADFVQHTGLERRPIEALILAGAFDSLGERRRLLWTWRSI
jgi:DNA polymerase III alpha subunit